ncbi:putative zinc finger protein [Diaporthe ampelina]|uniref:Putative zinc finger protein n=1 Tax=Diaporthe ampelina TaxID=1214573 RepID=A0A0G2FK65_9PEZI|nr:putative zinc finger protein [Diaporthe ampelina]
MLPRHMSEEQEHLSSIYPDPPQGAFSAAGMDLGLTSDVYFPRLGQDFPPNMNGFDHHLPYAADGPTGWSYGGRMSPPIFQEDREMGIPSNMSTASAPSAPSSAVGSPQSTHGQPAPVPEWAGPQGVALSPGIVGSHEYFTGSEYNSYAPQDPSLIHHEISRPLMPPYDAGFQQNSSAYPNSPALTASSPHLRTGSQSPFMPPNASYHYSPYPAPIDQGRRPSLVSYQSGHSGAFSDSDSKEKQRCPHPDCGKTFKDLKAHMLTHQTERPEKCPITTCEYHIKGFARKYDKNRHTLTHYKGTMVCGFCPGSGSTAEKSFNRADVFKRHLTAVHGVEQTPPNSRKNKNGASTSASTGKKPGPGYAPDATGKCSTCSQTFSNAQDFYEHLDDCVLRIVQQEDPAEAVNARRLAEVENDREVHATLEKNSLPTTTQTMMAEDDDDEELMEDEEGQYLDEQNLMALGVKTSASPTRKSKGNPANGVQKSRGLTHSRGGVSMSKSNASNRARKHRREYPSSWGFDKGQMTMKKRVMAVFDGPRRLAKDDMMLSTEREVRVPLADGKSYVTDLDVQTMKRAEGFLNATEEEKGIWISDDPTEEDIKAMLEAQMQ